MVYLFGTSEYVVYQTFFSVC